MWALCCSDHFIGHALLSSLAGVTILSSLLSRSFTRRRGGRRVTYSPYYLANFNTQWLFILSITTESIIYCLSSITRKGGEGIPHRQILLLTVIHFLAVSVYPLVDKNTPREDWNCQVITRMKLRACIISEGLVCLINSNFIPVAVSRYRGIKSSVLSEATLRDWIVRELIATFIKHWWVYLYCTYLVVDGQHIITKRDTGIQRTTDERKRALMSETRTLSMKVYTMSDLPPPERLESRSFPWWKFEKTSE